MKMASIKLKAALALVGCLMLPTPLLAEPFAVPGTADTATTVWYLMAPPYYGPPPFTGWIKVGTFPTKGDCEANASAAIGHYLRVNEAKPDPFCAPTHGHMACRASRRSHPTCVASDDPRLKEN